MADKKVKSTYKLHMSSGKFNQIIQKMCNDNFEKNGIEVRWTTSKQVDTAKLHHDTYGRPDYVVFRTDNLFGDSKLSIHGGVILSDFDAIHHICAVFHERRHYYQFTNLTGDNVGNRDFNKRLMCSIVGTMNNPAFYDLYYNKLLHERDAECTAVKRTYYYLLGYGRKNGISKNDIDQVMVQYVNDRHKLNAGYPVRRKDGKDFTGMDEILQRTSEVPKETVYLRHSLDYIRDYGPEHYCKPEDFSNVKFTDTALAAESVRGDVFSAYRRCRTLDEGLELFSAVDFALRYSFEENWAPVNKQLRDFGIRRFSTGEELEIRGRYEPPKPSSTQQSVKALHYDSMFPEFDAAAFGKSFVDNYGVPFGIPYADEADTVKSGPADSSHDVSSEKSAAHVPRNYGRFDNRRLPDVSGVETGDGDLDHQAGE